MRLQPNRIQTPILFAALVRQQLGSVSTQAVYDVLEGMRERRIAATHRAGGFARTVRDEGLVTTTITSSVAAAARSSTSIVLSAKLPASNLPIITASKSTKPRSCSGAVAKIA